jgi:hypothetical protein
VNIRGLTLCEGEPSHNLTLEKLLALMDSMPKLPEVHASEYCPRGAGYRFTVEGREHLIVHPDDLERFA